MNLNLILQFCYKFRLGILLKERYVTFRHCLLKHQHFLNFKHISLLIYKLLLYLINRHLHKHTLLQILFRYLIFLKKIIKFFILILNYNFYIYINIIKLIYIIKTIIMLFYLVYSITF